MSVVSVVNKINTETLTYLPTVVAVVQAVESLAPEGTSGPQKFTVAVDVISKSLAGSPNATVESIGVLVNLSVLIANLVGAFKKKPVPVVK